MNRFAQFNGDENLAKLDGVFPAHFGPLLDAARRGHDSPVAASCTEGVVTLADQQFFLGLVLLYLSVMEVYPVPIVCFDGGLLANQKSWVKRYMPLCTIRSIPRTAEIERIRQSLQGTSPNETQEWLLWICPFLIESSPFRRTLWLDSDLIVLRHLNQVFQFLRKGPVFTSENHAPENTANSTSLYDLLPIKRPFDRAEPMLNGGVSGWDLKRDAEILAQYKYPVQRAVEDESVRRAISWHDQGALIWAVQKTGKQKYVLQDHSWNLCARHGADPSKGYSLSNDLFEELRTDYPSTNILHWNGYPLPKKLCHQFGEESKVLRTLRSWFPGKRIKRKAIEKPRIHLFSYFDATADKHLIESFLDHYLRLGVDRMLIVLQGEEGGPHMETTCQLLDQHGVEPVLITPEYSAKLKQARCLEILDEYCRASDWVLLADVDELQIYPEPLPDFVNACDTLGYTFAKGQLIDRIAANGRLKPIQTESSIWDQFPYGASVTLQITTGCINKVCAIKGSLRPADGGSHSLDYGGDFSANYATTHRDPCGFPDYVEIHHFKWEASLVQRLKNKVEGQMGDKDARDGQGFMHEYRSLQNHLEQYGRLVVKNARHIGFPLSGLRKDSSDR